MRCVRGARTAPCARRGWQTAAPAHPSPPLPIPFGPLPLPPPQSASVRDHDRPISSQGRREAASISARLADLGWLPDLILASNSARTRQTLDAMIDSDARLGQADAHYLGRCGV